MKDINDYVYMYVYIRMYIAYMCMYSVYFPRLWGSLHYLKARAGA